MAAAGRSAGSRLRCLECARACARAGARAHVGAPARPDRAGVAHGPLGCLRHACTGRQAGLLRAGRRAVRGRHEQLLQRRPAVLRDRADEDARGRRPRDLRFLPRARPRDRSATSTRGGPRGGGRRRLGGDPIPVARRPLWRVDPRRRPLGARRPADDASDPGTPRRCRAHSRRGSGVHLGCGRQERRHLMGGLGPEPWVRRGDLGQLCLGCPVRRDPVLEKGENSPPDHGSEAWSLLAGDDARSVRLRPLARQSDSAFDRSRHRQAAERPAVADPLAGPEHLGEAGGEGRSAPRPAHHRRGAAGRARRARVGRGLPPLGRGRARLRRPQAGPDVHGLQLCATPRAG